MCHGTQSGVASGKREEYERTVQYVRNGAIDSQGNRLGWNVTISDDRYALHMSPEWWGWNARQHSDEWVAVEFAQCIPDELITDLQIDMFHHYAVVECPLVPRVFIMHSETEAGIADGKTDAAKRGQRADALRNRIKERFGL